MRSRGWLMMATDSLLRLSSYVEIRPAMIGTPSAAKNPGEITRNCAARVFLACGVIVTSRRIERGTRRHRAGSDHPEAVLLTPGSDQWRRMIPCKNRQLAACLSVKYGGNVDGKDMARVHPGLRPLQAKAA